MKKSVKISKKTELETVKGRQEVAEIKLDTVAAKLDTARDID